MSYSGARCDICPLRGQRVVMPIGPTTPKLVFVSDVPSVSDNESGFAMTGLASLKMDYFLAQLKLHRREVLFTYAALCRPAIPGVSGPRSGDPQRYLAWLRKNKAGENPFACCAPRLSSELAYVEASSRGPNGAVVIPLGPYSLASVLGKQRPLGILKYRGSVITDAARKEMAIL